MSLKLAEKNHILQKHTEATFHLHDKVPYKNHTNFRCYLNLCDHIQECLLENNVEHEIVKIVR